MGLLQAGIGALSTVLSDQWREYFYCESMSDDVLVTKGSKRVSGKSSNTKASDNVISNGSIVAVNEGQAMMIVEQGAIVEFSAEPGEFVWDSSTESTIFYGKFGESLKAVWEQLKKRFTFGGDTAKDQRVYYFNTKEILGNKYGTANPVPFRVVDKNCNLDMDIGLKCFGEYSYTISDPMSFYKNVCGNVSADYTRDRIDSQLKTELLTCLQPAFGRLSEMGIRYSSIVVHTTELCTALNEELTKYWASKNRGLAIVSFGITSLTANKEDEKRIQDMQATAALKDPSMAAATMTGATASAMQAAAANEGGMGAAMGFMGMNMAQATGYNNIAGLFQNQQAQQASAAPAAPAAGWTCSCGAVNTGKFCSECGAKKPEEPAGWTCPGCGTVNKGKFCSECGAKKPEAAPARRCNKCGWEPEDPAHPPKFCPECGDPFTDEDIKA